MGNNDEVTPEEHGYVCMKLPEFMGDGDSYTWQELQALETRRRTILRRTELPFWRILGSWDGTCLKVLATDGLLWVTLVMYALVRCFVFRGDIGEEYLAGFEDTNIDIIGGFLSFFLVLFVNQSNARFNTMYSHSMHAIELIQEVASIASCYLPKANAQRLVRYLNAAHTAGYVGLASETYSTHSFFMELNKKYKFLTEPELKRTTEIGMEGGADCLREIIMWAIREVQAAQKANMIDARMSAEMREKIQKLRGNILDLYHYKDQ